MAQNNHRDNGSQAMTSSTIRQKLRLKRRSEQTEKSFREIRQKMHEEEKLQREKKEMDRLNRIPIVANQVEYGAGGPGKQANGGAMKNYHQNLCVNVNISNVNIQGNQGNQGQNGQNTSMWNLFNFNQNYAYGYGYQQSQFQPQPNTQLQQQQYMQAILNQAAQYFPAQKNPNQPQMFANQTSLFAQPRQANENTRLNHAPIQASKPQKLIEPAYQHRSIHTKHKNYIVYTKLLGTGTYSKVYLGLDTRKNIQVAIKQLAELEQNEIKVLMSIQSPYIIKLQYFWKNPTTDLTYLVLDLCQRNLRQELKRNPTLDQKLKYIDHIIKGMDVLMEKNIIHRDLKFENIMISKEYVAKITDFGLAKDMGVMSNVESLRCGTPYTMAPQIFFHNGYGRPYYSQKCDIWSLAVIIHQMLYGRHPFSYQSDRMNKMERVHVDKKFGYFDAIIDRALVKEVGPRIGWAQLRKIYDSKGSGRVRELKMEASRKEKSEVNYDFKKKKGNEKEIQKEKSREAMAVIRNEKKDESPSSLLVFLKKKVQLQKLEIQNEKQRQKQKQKEKQKQIQKQRQQELKVRRDIRQKQKQIQPLFKPFQILQQQKPKTKYPKFSYQLPKPSPFQQPKPNKKPKTQSPLINQQASNKNKFMVPIDIFDIKGRQEKSYIKQKDLQQPHLGIEMRNIKYPSNQANQLILKIMFVLISVALLYILFK